MDNLTQNLIQAQENLEKNTFIERASFSSKSKGRFEPLLKEDFRSPYARDRDRIIHSNSFRRLKDKSQVFLLSRNDMIRTRLVHTLEVSQISRTVGRALRLNEDLTEAIALGHDLGHTPFGHIGERALSELCAHWFPSPVGKNINDINFLDRGKDWIKDSFTSYRHNVQSLRIVDFLEKKGEGLNLTYEVREGILYHSKWGGNLNTPNKKYLAKTLEGQIVRIADRIAYINHDLEDAFRSQMLSKSDIPKEFFDILGETHSDRVGRGVLSMIQYFFQHGAIGIEEDVAGAIDGLYKVLTEKIYRSPMMEEESRKAHFLIHELAYFYQKHPDLFAEKISDMAYGDDIPIKQKIIDYIANMTDHFILREFKTLRLPKGWAGF